MTAIKVLRYELQDLRRSRWVAGLRALPAAADRRAAPLRRRRPARGAEPDERRARGRAAGEHRLRDDVPLRLARLHRAAAGAAGGPRRALRRALRRTGRCRSPAGSCSASGCRSSGTAPATARWRARWPCCSAPASLLTLVFTALALLVSCCSRTGPRDWAWRFWSGSRHGAVRCPARAGRGGVRRLPARAAAASA